jgi:heme/copper-type cytochrome/quinol oxidase subunit 2
MRSRVAMATALSRGLCAVAGMLVLVGAGAVLGTSTAQADTTVVRDSMDVGLAGTVGVVAILVGVVGLVYGFTRRHRQSLARRAAERSAVVDSSS